jgi:hypothetical protein
MVKPTDADNIAGTVVAFPRRAAPLGSGRALRRDDKLVELEAENAKLRAAAVELMLEIRDLRTTSRPRTAQPNEREMPASSRFIPGQPAATSFAPRRPTFLRVSRRMR